MLKQLMIVFLQEPTETVYSASIMHRLYRWEKLCSFVTSQIGCGHDQHSNLVTIRDIRGNGAASIAKQFINEHIWHLHVQVVFGRRNLHRCIALAISMQSSFCRHADSRRWNAKPPVKMCPEGLMKCNRKSSNKTCPPKLSKFSAQSGSTRAQCQVWLVDLSLCRLLGSTPGDAGACESDNLGYLWQTNRKEGADFIHLF